MSSLTWIVSSCVLILAVIALRAAFGKKIRLETRYILWGLVLLRLLLPFEIGQSAWSVASAVQRTEWTRISRNLTALPDFDVSGYTGDETGVTAGAKDGIPSKNPVLPAANAAVRPSGAPQFRDVLRWVWYAGMALAAAFFLASNLRFYLRLRKRRVALDTECILKVYSVENLSSSCLFLGSIYVSAETAEDGAKLRHVLAHETAHHRHGDAVWALLRCAAVALHWYNPLVWWAAALSRRDSELLADAGALRSLGEDEREQYGVTLLKLSARKNASASLLCTATTMRGGKKALKERVVMIAKKPKAAVWAVVVVLAAAALAVGCTLAGAADSPVLRLTRGDILSVSVYDASSVETEGVWQMNGAEIDELYGRLSQIPLFLNHDDYEGLTPYYSLTVSVKDGDDLLIRGYDGGGTMTDILCRGTVYRVPDEEFQQYVRRVCAGETRTAAGDVQWDESPKLTLFGTRYRQIDLTPLDAPPEGYEYAGSLTDEQAGDTGAAGCPYYLDPRTDSVPDVYVFMPTASTGLGAADDTQPQWAYFRWVNEKIPSDAPDAEAPGKWDGIPWDESGVSVFGGADGPRGFSIPADLDHDGQQETVEVRVVGTDGPPIGAEISVPGTDLYFQLHTSHAGWGSVFKYVSPDDGRDYLLYYCPYFSTGSGAYWYELYDLTLGREPLRSNEVDFCIGPLGPLDLDGEKMEAFANEINALLEHSTLLASTDGGEIRLGPASAEPYYEAFTVPLSIFPYEGQEEAADLTLAEQIEYYEKALWAEYMMGTIPLFTEDVPQFLAYLSSHYFDWDVVWRLDNGAALDLINALYGYVGGNELDDGEFETLLRRTDGLDGAYAEAYGEVLEALWQRDSSRYLRIWSELAEGAQIRAIPYSVHEAVDFDGIEAARTWMNARLSPDITEVPE